MVDRYIQSMLSERERVLLETRQHWFVLLRAIIIELLLAAAIITAVILLTTLMAYPLGMLGLVLLLIPLVSGILDFMKWQNTCYLVTNRRIIQVSGIFDKHVTDSSLEKVNDLKLFQSFWGRFFGFGELEILTASDEGVDVFKHLNDPIRFKSAILNAKEDLDRFEDPSNYTKTQEDIPGLIARLDSLRQKGIVTEEEFQTKKAELLRKL